MYQKFYRIISGYCLALIFESVSKICTNYEKSQIFSVRKKKIRHHHWFTFINIDHLLSNNNIISKELEKNTVVQLWHLVMYCWRWKWVGVRAGWWTVADGTEEWGTLYFFFFFSPRELTYILTLIIIHVIFEKV